MAPEASGGNAYRGVMPDGGPRYHGLESIGHSAKSRPPETTTGPVLEKRPREIAAKSGGTAEDANAAPFALTNSPGGRCFFVSGGM